LPGNQRQIGSADPQSPKPPTAPPLLAGNFLDSQRVQAALAQRLSGQARRIGLDQSLALTALGIERGVLKGWH